MPSPSWPVMTHTIPNLAQDRRVLPFTSSCRFCGTLSHTNLTERERERNEEVCAVADLCTKYEYDSCAISTCTRRALALRAVIVGRALWLTITPVTGSFYCSLTSSSEWHKENCAVLDGLRRHYKAQWMAFPGLARIFCLRNVKKCCWIAIKQYHIRDIFSNDFNTLFEVCISKLLDFVHKKVKEAENATIF